jgi:demethylmenaquinone methyltransferase/2-methoxy-6-polyprenyl-1,4-benzoquinol methylase
MFGRIAGRYDRMNHVMTLGRDQSWRRYTVAQTTRVSSTATGATAPDQGEPNRERVLDVATGTGDLALEVLRQRSSAQVVGLDFTPEMLTLAQHKAVGAGVDVDLMVGDALRLPFADAEFDAVVSAFALRNVTDIPAAFTEMARVTCPGGRVANLEIAKPSLGVFRWLFSLYFYRFVPLIGRWITGDRLAYSYLPHSLTAFLTPDEIQDVMNRTGWRDVTYRRMMFGTVAVHVGTRVDDVTR